MNKYIYSLILFFSIGACLASESTSQEITPQQFVDTALQISTELAHKNHTPLQLQKSVTEHAGQIGQFINYINKHGILSVYHQMAVPTTAQFNALLVTIERCAGIYAEKPASIKDDEDDGHAFFIFSPSEGPSTTPSPVPSADSTPSPKPTTRSSCPRALKLKVQKRRSSRKSSTPSPIIKPFFSQETEFFKDDEKEQRATPNPLLIKGAGINCYEDFEQEFERCFSRKPCAGSQPHDLPDFIETTHDRIFSQEFSSLTQVLYHTLTVLCQRQYIPCTHIFDPRTHRIGGGHFLDTSRYNAFISSMESVVQNVDTGIIYTVQSNASRTPTLSSVSPSPSPLGQAPVDRSENATCMQFDESMLDETSIIRILRAVDLGLEGREHAHNHPCHFAIVTINGQEVPLEMIYRGNIMHSAYPVFSYTDLTTTTTMILNILPIRPAKGISASYTHSRQEIIGSINGCDQKHLTDMIKYQVKQDDVNYLIVDIASLLSTAVKRGIYVKVCSSDIHQAPAPE